MLGHHGPSYDVYGEFFNSTVMNYSFGGSFNSRLNLNLKTKDILMELALDSLEMKMMDIFIYQHQLILKLQIAL